MKLVKNLMLAGLLAMAGVLSGCADGGGNDELITIINGGDPGTVSNQACVNNPQSVLDGVQCSVTTLVDDLADIVAGTPLEDFVQCIDPLGNDVVEGPDSVLNTLLIALATQNPDPAAFQAAIMDLANALASAGTNLPAALQALGGDPAAIAYCNGGSPPGGSGAPSLALLCAIPTLGPAVVEAVTPGACSGTPSGSPLDPGQLAALCAVPTLGPALLNAVAPGTCAGGGGGGAPSLAALCAIPTLGPALVEAVNGAGACGAPSGDPLDPAQLSALCAVPVLGPAVLNGIQAGTCP